MASNDSPAGLSRRGFATLVAGALAAVRAAAQRTAAQNSPGPALDIAEWSYFWFGVEHVTLGPHTQRPQAVIRFYSY